MSESLTTKQVAEHNTVDNGLYIIIDGGVYKMDTFVDEHPGGAKILKRVGGKDASKQFWKVCHYFFEHGIQAGWRLLRASELWKVKRQRKCRIVMLFLVLYRAFRSATFG